MEIKSPKFTECGNIDAILAHPIHGDIPVTLSECDPETSDLFEKARRMGPIAFSPPQDRTLSEDEKREIARSYLKSTDWYVIRMIETGEQIPEAVSAQRAEARMTASS